MSRNFIHINKTLCFLFFFLFCFLYSLSAEISHVSNATWHDFSRLLDVQKGSHVSGVSDLKKYLHKFGYGDIDSKNISDVFDGHLESAISLYQKNLGLPITGKLDLDTVNLMSSPRCGVSDSHMINGNHAHYSHFAGTPKWKRNTPFTLTYAFSKTHKLDYVTPDDIKAVFRRAFDRWTTVIPLSFEEIDDETKADLKIAFFIGDHGDGHAFDGVLGTLGHAFSPENGRAHFDAAEIWNVDEYEFKTESKVAVDLESVAIHEIGHLLGLGHSSEKSAVMYPTVPTRAKKVDLSVDDVAGIVKLYGQNPSYRFNESEDSFKENGAVRSDRFLLGNFARYALLVVLMRFLVS